MAGAAMVADGGASPILVGPGVPKSRMVPVVSTAPGFTLAMAASTLLGACPQKLKPCPAHVPVVSFAAGFNVARAAELPIVAGAAKHATGPGWLITSEALSDGAASDLPSTWLLLNTNRLPPRLIRLPKVPMQQAVELSFSTSPPEVPSLMAPDWRTPLSF